MTKHIIIGFTYASIFGLTFMFTKIGLSYIEPVGLMAFRFLMATLVLSLLAFFKVITIHIPRHVFKTVLLMVLFQPVIGFAFEMYGVKFSQSSEAGMIIALIPVFVAILSFMFSSEKPTIKQVLFILISVTGVIFIQLMNVRGVDGFSPLGAILMLVSALAAASFNVVSRHVSKLVTPGTLTFMMMFTGFIFFMSWYIISLIITGEGLHPMIESLSSLPLLGSILYLGVIASVIGFFLVNYNLKHIPAHMSSIFANVATMTSIIAGLIFLNETLYWYHFVGSVFIMIGVYGVVASRKKKSIAQTVEIPV
ncbi:MAG: DMT family transporter [Acholeplasmataceae bacterium]